MYAEEFVPDEETEYTPDPEQEQVEEPISESWAEEDIPDEFPDDEVIDGIVEDVPAEKPKKPKRSRKSKKKESASEPEPCKEETREDAGADEAVSLESDAEEPIDPDTEEPVTEDEPVTTHPEPVAQVGQCPYCGQGRHIENEKELNDVELEEAIVMQCNCSSAMRYRSLKAAKDNVGKLMGEEVANLNFRPQSQVVRDAVSNAAELIYDNELDKAVFTLGDGDKITVSSKKCKIEITREKKEQLVRLA